MDDRRVENIRKFFDRVNRDDPVHGYVNICRSWWCLLTWSLTNAANALLKFRDIAMILNDPFTSNMIASRLLVLLNEATQSGRVAHVRTRFLLAKVYEMTLRETSK